MTQDITNSMDLNAPVQDQAFDTPQPSIKIPATHSSLSFQMTELSSHLVKATIIASESLFNSLLAQTVDLFRNDSFEGFDKSKIPSEYVEETYQAEIYSKIKNYIFHHLVIDYLIHEVIDRNIALANYPRLSSIETSSTKEIKYHFDISIADPIELKEWKLFAFKSPKRKKYKDLDKQVIAFIEQRSATAKKPNPIQVEESDWVFFDAMVVNPSSKQPVTNLSSCFWIRIDQQEVTEPLIDQLIGRHLDTCFHTNHLDLYQHGFKSEKHCYTYLITIKALIKGSHFSPDLFRSTFKLKSKIDVHNKLMEVFSYRNDVSQRKAIIEEVFHLLLSKHRFEVPKHLVLRREEDILAMLVNQPDYHVYKAHEDFEEYVEMLAEKQLKEEIVIDQIAYHEDIRADLRDMQHYLHLISNKKLKEFIYFKPILAKIDEQEGPLNVNILAQAVMREKTLNHVIHTLNK